MEDKSALSLVEESPAENPTDELVEEVPAITPDEVFSPEELAMKAKIAEQFAAMNDREILETILHNQLALRQGQELIIGTLSQMNSFADQFKGMKPSDILKQMMGKKGN